MRLAHFGPLAAFIAIALGACVPLGQTGPNTYSKQMTVEDISPTRTKVNTDLAIVFDDSLKDKVTWTKADGKMILEVSNYRGAIETVLTKALAANFRNVSTQPAETKKGLELLMLQAQPTNDTDNFTYHAALQNNGETIYEIKETIKPPPVTLHTTIFTWLDDMADYTFKLLQSHVKEMTETVYTRMMINNPETTKVWQSYR